MSFKISVIIPTRSIDAYTKQCIAECKKLDYKDYEILVVCDKQISEEIPGVKLIPAGDLLPGVKKNIGVRYSTGEICAFIDSDAFPKKDWLKKAANCFQNEDIAAVGGPNLTPGKDTISQKLSGLVLSSPLACGKFSTRYKISHPYFPVELPSCNLIVKKHIIEKVNGFAPDFLTAEDADLCFKISQLNKKIFYSPEVIVFHHRRHLFIPYFKQIFTYGRDKSSLLRKIPIRQRFSKMCYFFIPSVFFLIIFCVIGSFFIIKIRIFILTIIFLYLFLLLTESLRLKTRYFHALFLGLLGTHVSYLLGFLNASLGKTGINFRK